MEEERSSYWTEGYNFHNGPINPYDEGTIEYKEWFAGYYTALFENC